MTTIVPPVENCGNPGQGPNRGGSGGSLEACSACAGDYEDPDRTTWEGSGDDEEGEEDESEVDWC